jgi:hydroxymethylbilane synthase
VTALRIGTRSSALALWQANHVATAIGLQNSAPGVELVHIETEGDQRTDVPLWAVPGRAFFTKEIDNALLEERIDIAVHSLKDLATQLPGGVTLAAVLPRENPADVLLCREPCASWQDLPAGARVGTSSLRRRALLAAMRPDLQLTELRGNVPTRIKKMQTGEYDAIVLAQAGLNRLGINTPFSMPLSLVDFPPAVSQGAIGVCARHADQRTLRWLQTLDDRSARLETTAERALLRHLQGGCQVPMGAVARLNDNELRLSATVCALDGSRQLKASGHSAPELQRAVLLGVQVADQLFAQGAAELIAAQRSQAEQ